MEFPGQCIHLKAKGQHRGSRARYYLEDQCMAKRFIYLANDILPHCGLSPLKSVVGVLWLTAGKSAFNQRKVLLQRMSASIQIVLIDIVQTAEKSTLFVISLSTQEVLGVLNLKSNDLVQPNVKFFWLFSGHFSFLLLLLN